MPVNVFISMYYGFDRVTAIGDDEYVIEIKLNSDETNTYFVTEKETGIQIYMMQYNDVIRYTIPKDKLGSYLLTEDISNKVIDYSVRYIGGDLSKDEVALKDLMMIK